MNRTSSVPLSTLKPAYSRIPSLGNTDDSIFSAASGYARPQSEHNSLSLLLEHDSDDNDDARSRKCLRLPQAWRFGATLASITAACVLVVNLAVAIWAYFKSGKQSNGHVYEGACDDVNMASIGIHLLINVLSTLLLGGSQYIMQCLCAPTRREINLAHSKGVWLDIGQPSLRNLRFIRRWKLVVWVALVLSSLPLHLFYNSVFYSSLAHNDYDIYFASEKYLEGAAYNTSKFPSPGTEKYEHWDCFDVGDGPVCDPAPWLTDPKSVQKDALQWDRLENEECISAYAQEFLAGRRNLVLIVDDLDNTTSSLYELERYQLMKDYYETINPEPYYWICSHDYGYWKEDYPPCSSTVGGVEADASNWAVYGYRIRYCQSEKVEQKCRLNFNLPVLGIVIVFNAVKLGCMAFVTYRMHDKPVITLGDAVSSFLRLPDATTKGMCLATRVHFQRCRDWSQEIETPMTYRRQKMRWMKTASNQHWLVTVSLFILALATILGLLGYSIPHLKTSYGHSGISSLWSLGVGKTRSETMIEGWAIPTRGESAVISAILVANSPQLILSLIYVFFNGLCTRMLLAREWSSFARHRKALRVSSPRGEQRSTYFLQLPYRYGVPLMIYSTVLHWLVSQSIFLARVETWDSAGAYAGRESVTTCGYSPMGIILTAIVAACLVLTGFGMGLRHLDSDMPIAGGCSAAISAACHPPDEISEKLPLQWGAVPTDETSGAIGHCSFSSGDVEEPVPGNLYA